MNSRKLERNSASPETRRRHCRRARLEIGSLRVLAAGVACVTLLTAACAGGGETTEREEAATGTTEPGQTTTTAPAGPSPRGCVRPYSDDSPWNSPIPRSPALHPKSSVYVRGLEGPLTSDPTQYTYPVYHVSADTSRETVGLRGWFSNVVDGGRRLENQRAGTVELPIPEGARAAAGTDAQMILLDPVTRDEWGLSELERDGDGWKAWNAYHYNTRWNGVPPRDENGKPFFNRGAGVPYLAGLVRPCEIRRGRIEHALAFAYDSPSEEYVYPATKSDGVGEPDDMPEGTRLQLDPRLTAKQIRKWGCTGPCLTIARALQEYGMYVIDNSGRPKVILEYEGTAHWRGLVDDETVSPIPFRAFRVLAFER
jgi:hypothetical protein